MLPEFRPAVWVRFQVQILWVVTFQVGRVVTFSSPTRVSTYLLTLARCARLERSARLLAQLDILKHFFRFRKLLSNVFSVLF